MENIPEEELHDKKSDHIKDMYQNVLTPANMERKIIDRLKNMNLIRGLSAADYRRIAAIIIIIPALFAAGFFLGKNNLKSNSMTKNETGTYLLLLYQPKNFIADEEAHIKEYGAWLKDLQELGKLESGEKLRDKSWLLSAGKQESFTEIELEKGVASGFFIIKAASESEALAVANTCPHLKYNGLVEVRPIEPTH